MGDDGRLRRRVTRAAEEALEARGSVSPIDVLIGLGWLHPVHLDPWRQRRVADLEQLAQVGPEKMALAMQLLRRWAAARGLEPSETEYLARSRAREPLRFTATGDEAAEREFRTRWHAPGFTEPDGAGRTAEPDGPGRTAEPDGPGRTPEPDGPGRTPEPHGAGQAKPSRPPELVVISPRKDFTCSVCGAESGGLLIMENGGPVCMACADMDHLVFLPAGDAALTRRAKAASGLWAVVVRFARARRRYERQGLLVEEDALAQAEASCLADQEVRARRRVREAARRADSDRDLQKRMADEIQRLFPGCPPARAQRIAAHAAARGSGRVGRSAAGRGLDPRAIELAVVASVRHEDTGYDELLMQGLDREAARAQVRERVFETIDAWRGAGVADG